MKTHVNRQTNYWVCYHMGLDRTKSTSTNSLPEWKTWVC